MKLLRKILRETDEEFVQHHVAENVFRGGGLDRFDAFDGVDLVRAVFALAFLDSGEERTQDLLREIHQPAVEWSGGEKGEHQRGAVERHEGKRADQLHEREEGADAVVDGEFPHLPRAVEPALDVAGATAGEITHRQRQHLPAQEIEDRGVQPDGGEGEQILLGERRGLNEEKGRAHPEQDGFEKADVLLDDHLVDHHLGEDREEQLEERDGDREQHHLDKDRFELGEERQDPGERPACFPARSRTRSCNRKAPCNPTSLARILCAEFCAARARDRPPSHRCRQRRRAPSSGCLPSARSPAAASAADCGARP